MFHVSLKGPPDIKETYNMGGCCCCPSKGTEQNIPPAYYYCSRTAEENVPLSSRQGSAPEHTSGLVVDTNLDTSVPDSYGPPPPPVPFNAGGPQIPPRNDDMRRNKSGTAVQATNSVSAVEVAGGYTQANLTKTLSDCLAETDFDLEMEKEQEIELSKSANPVILPVEECPTCLEEYDDENPKIITKCEHHFHLACILEWMERSDTCPVCDKEMVFSPPIN